MTVKSKVTFRGEVSEFPDPFGHQVVIADTPPLVPGSYTLTMERLDGTSATPQDEETGEHPVVLFCRRTECKFCVGDGVCSEAAPCITLNPDGTAMCYSRVDREPELKPCPGLHDEVHPHLVVLEEKGKFRVVCPCGWKGPTCTTKAAATSAWNERT